ncbi:synaptotagmin-3-like isoform X2 [Malus domestica]|uniref:synaptotagmin-3-like isoform X2 n=1 Tax=Malus domestica TaxID=3750 RepID=UPI0010A9DE37|nr:synaptotagmin-3-like isoform X3 [Malus domestica]
MGWKSQHNFGVKSSVFTNYNSVSRFTSVFSAKDSFQTACAFLSMFCKHCGVFDGEASYRFWNEYIGSRYHVYTRPLSFCSGAALETIKMQVASLYLWPRTLEIPILDVSTVAVKKPVGILRVNVVHAVKLLKKDILGSSDPYVKLSLTGDGLPAKKTTIKKKNLNPEWNEKFKLLVKDPKTQLLRLQVFDWDKVGGHDRIGMQLVPLKQLTPHETKEFKLDLLKDTSISNSPNKKQRGQLVVELAFVPFKEDKSRFSGPIDAAHTRNESGIDMSMSSLGGTLGGAGLLSVIIQGAENVEGKYHNNPYAILLFRGEQKKTHMLRKTRDPSWNEEFPFMLDEPPLNEKVHIEVVSKRTGISFRMKESLGHVEINLRDVVHNGRINHKYHLINSKNGVIHVEISWKMI